MTTYSAAQPGLRWDTPAPPPPLHPYICLVVYIALCDVGQLMNLLCKAVGRCSRICATLCFAVTRCAMLSSAIDLASALSIPLYFVRAAGVHLRRSNTLPPGTIDEVKIDVSPWCTKGVGGDAGFNGGRSRPKGWRENHRVYSILNGLRNGEAKTLALETSIDAQRSLVVVFDKT